MPNSPAKASTRLSREQWLDKALEVLAEQGPSRLNIGAVSAALGVSRGSFYWHFRDRDDFVRALLDYWHRTYTAPATEEIPKLDIPPREKFRLLLTRVIGDDLNRFELPIRSWAMQDPAIAELVMNTDRARLNFVRDLLGEIGFSGFERELRARSFISYLMTEKQFFDEGGPAASLEHVDELCRFFIGDE